MNKKLKVGLLIALSLVMMTACGPSKSKIEEAQNTYKELLTLHNQAVEAYKAINEDSLNSELNTLSDKVSELTEYNLYDMSDNEIDALIDTMNSLNSSYSGYLKTIGEIKISEDAVALEPVMFTLINNTHLTFDTLTLMERGESDLVTDALDRTDGFDPGESIAGLTIHRDADDTPWILTLNMLDEEGVEVSTYKLIIDSTLLPASEGVLSLKWNEEAADVYIE